MNTAKLSLLFCFMLVSFLTVNQSIAFQNENNETCKVGFEIHTTSNGKICVQSYEKKGNRVYFEQFGGNVSLNTDQITEILPVNQSENKTSNLESQERPYIARTLHVKRGSDVMTSKGILPRGGTEEYHYNYHDVERKSFASFDKYWCSGKMEALFNNHPELCPTSLENSEKINWKTATASQKEIILKTIGNYIKRCREIWHTIDRNVEREGGEHVITKDKNVSILYKEFVEKFKLLNGDKIGLAIIYDYNPSVQKQFGSLNNYSNEVDRVHRETDDHQFDKYRNFKPIERKVSICSACGGTGMAKSWRWAGNQRVDVMEKCVVCGGTGHM